MTREQGPRRSSLAGIAAGLVALVLAFGPQTTTTDSSWTRSQSATATVSAPEVGPVQSLQCADSKDALLQLGQDTVLLSWEPPTGLPADAEIDYELAWARTSGRGAGTATVSTPEFHFKPATSLLDIVPIHVRVTSRVGQWRGPALTQEISSVSALGLSVRVACGKLLGIL